MLMIKVIALLVFAAAPLAEELDLGDENIRPNKQPKVAVI